MVRHNNAKDEKGRFATNHLKNKTMRVTQEEKDHIMARRMEKGVSTSKTLIKESKSLDQSCHFCGKNDHIDNIPVGFSCLKEFLTGQEPNSDYIKCQFCNDLIDKNLVREHIVEVAEQEKNGTRDGWQHSNYLDA